MPGFLGTIGGLAAVPLLAGGPAPGRVQATGANMAPGRRRLGALEVSSIGLGVRNMSPDHDPVPPRDDRHHPGRL